MKKMIIAAVCAIALYVIWNTAYYRLGIYIDWHPNEAVTAFMKTDATQIYQKHGEDYLPFEIRGVNMGVGLPGKWATDYAIDKETYLRWFRDIQEMGANTIRVYTILHEDFYNAFYEYNLHNDAPLYLIHGVWVNDYTQNSHRDAYDDSFRQTFLDDCRTVVDILHGKKTLLLGRGLGTGNYRKDISPWVIGYILGVEWEDVTVVYTNNKYPERNRYAGTYMYTTAEATPFEAMLCEVGDKIIEYESGRYKQQRLVAFSNWPTTDPFDYSEAITRYFMKCGKVDVEHIKTTGQFLAGQFASYHVYPYYPDYLAYAEDKTGFPCTEDGRLNTYLAYLKTLTAHHTIPVVISEYGVSTGRGMAQRDQNTGRNQGHMSEKEQGQAVIECYRDIKEAGCAGSCVFTWQDEWFKRTWNTMHAVDLEKTPYWSDYQTNEQYFGLLAFDPGKQECVSYVDGELSEWSEADRVAQTGDMTLSMKYDEKFIYFLIQNFDAQQDVLYIPLDITPKTGSNYCENFDIKFDRACDFVIVIDGKDNSRVLVQERYEVLRAMFYHETHDMDAYLEPVDEDTPVFKPINLILQTATPLMSANWQATSEVYETGLLKYGNANPSAEEFDSLADFIFSGDAIELKLPWQLLNFSNPSEMQIHDDYYQHYGVENLAIHELHVGLGSGEEQRIALYPVALNGWGKRVTYHERLKASYYALREFWRAGESDRQ